MDLQPFAFSPQSFVEAPQHNYFHNPFEFRNPNNHRWSADQRRVRQNKYYDIKEEKKESGNDKYDKDGNKYQEDTPRREYIGFKSVPTYVTKYKYKKRKTYKRKKMARKYSKKYGKRSKKRYGRKMRLTGQNMLAKLQRNLVSAGLGFPKMMKMNHKWTAVVTLDSPAGALATYNFVANGLYRPDTGTATSPLYYSQMAAVYDHYTVIASKIRVVYVGTAGTVANWGVFINDDGTVTPTTSEACKQQTTGTWKIWTAAAGTHENMISKKYGTKKNFGGSILSNDNLQGALAANPTETSLYTVWLSSAQSPAVQTTARLAVEIDYIAIWKEVRDIN